MSYSIKTIKPFDRQAKRLVKKYSSLKTELRELVAALASDPTQGQPGAQLLQNPPARG